MLKQGSAGEGGAETAGLAPVQGAGEQGQGPIQVSQAHLSFHLFSVQGFLVA